MTILINLESYLECCQYAYLFGEDPAKLIPNSKSLSLAYRDFCRRHQSQSFLPIPATTSAQPKILTPRKGQLPQQNIGLTLPDNTSEQIFIVKEVNSLVLRSLQSRYIYANVYRYWSYVEQLQQFTNSDKPLVIYDLDSFTPAQITPLTFENHRNAPYPIPIIDTRSLKQYDALKLSQPYEKTYDSICLEIANKLVQDLNLDINNLLEVVNYIKKINFFQNIEFASSEHIILILEINHRFYTYNLSQKNLEDIVYRHLPILALNDVIDKNSNYHFVLLGSYTKLSGVRRKLQQQFKNTLSIPYLSVNSFPEIWKQKVVSSFALFGQHLDRISFSVRRAGENIEIYLPDRTCYEGEQEAVVYGQYTKDGKLEENFPLTTKDVTLPFQINDKPFVDNETGVEQIYKIENQYFDQTPNLDIKICFRLKPGLAPKLEILDNYERIVDSKLIDLDKSQLQRSKTLGFIPMAQISESRKEKSIKGIEKLIESNFIHDLDSFSKVISSNTASISIKLISKKISEFRTAWKTRLIPIFVVIDQQYLTSIVQSYLWMGKILEDLLKKLASDQNIPADIKPLLNNAHRDLLLIVGDGYALTHQMNLNFLFDLDILSQPQKKVINWVEQVLNAAKISCSTSRQKMYLNLFEQHTNYRKKHFYKTDEYIWGYARLLLWYVDMGNPQLIPTYNKHFLVITNHCLTLNANNPRERTYTRDALIALIYLLTFREIDPHFVEKGSQSYNKSKKLCDKLTRSPILSKKANIELPLNQFFEQLLDGSATQEQVSNMIEID